MYDRFDLEEEIHKVWATEEDLDTILYRIIDAPATIANKESNHPPYINILSLDFIL